MCVCVCMHACIHVWVGVGEWVDVNVLARPNVAY